MDLTKFHNLDVILLCGLHGAGKSHFAKAYFGSSQERFRISRREIRRFFYEMTHFGQPWKSEMFFEEDEALVKQVERRIYEHYLQSNRKLLIESTNLDMVSRKHYIDLAKTMGKTVGVIFLNIPLQKCMQRNHQSQFPVSDMVLSRLTSQVKLPIVLEGFKEVLVLNDY
jgi:predicted kinase